MEAIDCNNNDLNKFSRSNFVNSLIDSSTDNGIIYNTKTANDNDNDRLNIPSSNEKFGKLLFRKLSSFRKPGINACNTDQYRRSSYIVEISCIFIRLGEIDTLRETFFAEAFLQAKWIDKNLTGNTYDPEKDWNPDIIIENAIKGLSVKKTYSVKERDKFKKGLVVCEKWIFKGIFWQSLTLKNFPIDVQELTISLASLKPIDEIKFKQSNAKISAVIQEGFIDQQEWKLYSFVSLKEVLVSNKFSADAYPSFLITAHICRRPNYYYYNAFFLIFLITLSSMTTFSMSCELPQSRLQTTCTVLLTSITFKWVINRSLPLVYYLTSLDLYSLKNIIFICFKCFWHALIGYLNNQGIIEFQLSNNGVNMSSIVRKNQLKNDDSSSKKLINQCNDPYKTADYIAFFVFLFGFIIMNFSFIYWFFYKAKLDSRILDDREINFLNELKKDDDNKHMSNNNDNANADNSKNMTRKYRYTSIYVSHNANKKKLVENTQQTEVEEEEQQQQQHQEKSQISEISIANVYQNKTTSPIHISNNTTKPTKKTHFSKNIVKRAVSHLPLSIYNFNEKYSKRYELNSKEKHPYLSNTSISQLQPYNHNHNNNNNYSSSSNNYHSKLQTPILSIIGDQQISPIIDELTEAPASIIQSNSTSVYTIQNSFENNLNL